jgi:putative OmpA-OmpF-like porin
MFIKPFNMKKTLIILFLVLGVVTLVGAQESQPAGEFNDGENCYKYKFSLNLGKSFSTSNIIILDGSTYSNYSSSVQPVVPYVYGIDQINNPSTNMIGVEFRWMFKPNWSLNLTGLGVLMANPSQDAIRGIQENPDDSDSGWIIPNINSVAFEADFDWNIEIGVSRYFDLPNKNLLPYLGFSFIYAHGSDRYEVPFTVDEAATLKSCSTEIDPMSLRGMQKGELITWGFAVPVGVEYYVAEGLFIGFSINAVNYFYSLAQIAPGEGMDLARADQSTFSFLTRPIFKVGIAF